MGRYKREGFGWECENISQGTVVKVKLKFQAGIKLDGVGPVDNIPTF